MPWFLQEKLEGAHDDDPTLMIMWLDNNWVILEPGWGVADSIVLARSDWLDMLVHCQGNMENNTRMNLSDRRFFVPHDAGAICGAICLHHGQSWLNERLNAEITAQIQQQNASLADKLTDEPMATSGADGSEAAGDNWIYHGDEQDDRHQQHNTDKPQAVSLNHKCAFIVAYERRDWKRVEYLCAVLLGLATIQ